MHIRGRSFYRIGMVSDDDVVPKFTIDSETDREHRRFNARGTELAVRLLHPCGRGQSGCHNAFSNQCERSF